jgi:threonine/homoserine efflux transporter RhtA
MEPGRRGDSPAGRGSAPAGRPRRGAAARPLALLRREAGRVVLYGLVAIAGGQLCYFNAIESVPIGLAVLLEYLGVVLVVG